MIIGAPKDSKNIEYTEQDKSQLLYDPKIRHYQTLGNSIQALRSTRRLKVGFTNGKFRLLHPGHAVFLSLCKTKCDILIVGVNSDYSLRLLGEPSKFTDKERAFSLATLSVVDYVTIFDEETPFNVISHLNPDIIFKGYDYENKEVVSAGKEVCIVKHPFNIHTKDLIETSEPSSEYKHFKV